MDVLWDKFSTGGLPHLERCQLLLLHPLRPLSVPSAGVTEYGPSLPVWRLGLLCFLTVDYITSLLHQLIFMYLKVLFWFQVKYKLSCENWETKSLEKLLCSFRITIEIAPSVEVTFSPRSPLWSPKLIIWSLLMISQDFIFIRVCVITLCLLAHLFVYVNCESEDFVSHLNGIYPSLLPIYYMGHSGVQ